MDLNVLSTAQGHYRTKIFNVPTCDPSASVWYTPLSYPAMNLRCLRNHGLCLRRPTDHITSSLCWRTARATRKELTPHPTPHPPKKNPKNLLRSIFPTARFANKLKKGEKTHAELFFHKNQCLADRPEGGLKSNKPGLNPGELASAGKGAGGGSCSCRDVREQLTRRHSETRGYDYAARPGKTKTPPAPVIKHNSSGKAAILHVQQN